MRRNVEGMCFGTSMHGVQTRLEGGVEVVGVVETAPLFCQIGFSNDLLRTHSTRSMCLAPVLE